MSRNTLGLPRTTSGFLAEITFLAQIQVLCSYILTGLEPGQYILSVAHPDYDPGLSSIFTVAASEEHSLDLPLYEPDTSPYPKDPMLTNPLDPNGAPTQEDAERLAREQGFTGQVVSIREIKLSGEFLVNYKIADDIRAAVAEVRHEVWELIDESGRKWWIIKVCGNLASMLPGQAPIPTPEAKPLPPMAETMGDKVVLRSCASVDCVEVGALPGGERAEVFGCLANGSWCEVGWSGRRGWCTGQSLRQLAVAEAVPVVQAMLPTAMPLPPVPVNALPINLTPETLVMPTGTPNCFDIAALQNWDGTVRPTWSVEGLPARVTSQFLGAGSGNPTSGCLQINPATSVPEGTYPIQIRATVPGKTWVAQVTLNIIVCEEFEPGVYTGVMDNLISAVVAGKPDTRNGLMIPLLVCDDSRPRKLKVTIDSAISEAGTPLLTPIKIYLFRSLVFPAPDHIHAHNPVFLNVEQEYATNEGWSLEAKVMPGLYLLVFEHDSYEDYANPREAKDIPRSVTYRVETVPVP